MVREDFAISRSSEHLALVAAVAEGAALCADAAFRPELIKLLARAEYLNLPVRVLSPALQGPIALGAGQGSRDASDYIRFHAHEANTPTPMRAQWIIDGLMRHSLIPAGTVVPPNLARRVFRADLYTQALRRQVEFTPVSV
jgi:ABC-type nitrate/sulfonate/bicarbonate transport system substrate-binding protein